jgi:hypothetical protein
LSWDGTGFKRVGLHYIEFWNRSIASKGTCVSEMANNRENHQLHDELRLAPNTVHLTILIRLAMSMRRVRWRLRGRRL